MESKVDLNFRFEFELDRIIGYYDYDIGHNTFLSVDGENQTNDGPGYISARYPKRGDSIIFSIPSGKFEGTVINVFSQTLGKISVVVRGVWNGIFGGLVGGMSVYGRFYYHIDEETTVTSSWGTMTYSEYHTVRTLRECPHADRAYRTFKKLERSDCK